MKNVQTSNEKADTERLWRNFCEDMIFAYTNVYRMSEATKDTEKASYYKGLIDGITITIKHYTELSSFDKESEIK